LTGLSVTGEEKKPKKTLFPQKKVLKNGPPAAGGFSRWKASPSDRSTNFLVRQGGRGNTKRGEGGRGTIAGGNFLTNVESPVKSIVAVPRGEGKGGTPEPRPKKKKN